MQLKFVKGVPPALFDNFIKFLSQQEKKNYIYTVRFNSSLEAYFNSCEFLDEYSYAGIIQTLGEFGYQRVKTTSEVGEFDVKGDLLSLWIPGMSDPVRMSFFGDDLEEIYTYDVLTGRKILKLKNLPAFNLTQADEKADRANINYLLQDNQEFLKEAFILSGINEIKKNYEFDYSQAQLYFGRFDLLEKDIEKYEDQGFKVKIITHHQLPEHLKKYTKTELKENIPLADPENFEMGFISEKEKMVVLTDRELFGTIFITTRQRKTLKSSEAQKLLNQLEGEIEIGDYIVHEDYGVGIYRGFVVENELDYLQVEYAQEDELLVPLDQINKLTKFIGEQGQRVEITRLGKNQWQILTKKVKKEVAIAAKELARHYAFVNMATATPVELEDSEGYKSFLDKFPYKETPDQLKAEKEVITDLAKKNPMNRLLIGDVGFGKTEIMMRAAYKVLDAGKQVVILCPTTVLSLQHFNTFRDRFSDTPFNIELLSRYNTSAKNREVIEKFKEGKVDMVVGTHRLLTSDFQPKEMGLLIVDEEQRFGVKQKEKIRKLEYGVHTLYVSATPIPRTLSMALSAIKDISMIQTPPEGRKPVQTDVSKLNWVLVAQSIEKELSRGGQVIFVHNEVKTIQSILLKLQTILPKVKFAIGHGQMASNKLDEVMTKFYKREVDCLIATTIIENGLDMPNVNTIIINNAHKLGLSQMYQLRGRVGRSDRQAFAHFFYQGRQMPGEEELQQSVLTDDGEEIELKPAKYLERLETILSSQSLGSGFKIASRDLEIRGAGNLLGREQSGNISKVGYGLYMQMLAEEVEKLKATVSLT